MAVTVVAVPCGMRAEVGSRTWKVHREVEDEQEASQCYLDPTIRCWEERQFGGAVPVF